MHSSINRLFLLSFLSLLLTGCHISSRTTIPDFIGQVVDSTTQKPIADAHIVSYSEIADEKPIQSSSDKNGIFYSAGSSEFVIYPILCCAPTPPGVAITVNADGYKPYHRSIHWSELRESVLIQLERN